MDPSPTPHCCIEFKLSLSLRVMLGIRLMWSSTQLPTQRSISERTAGSLAPESKRSFALSLQCIVHLVSRSWEGRDAIKYAINSNTKKKHKWTLLSVCKSHTEWENLTQDAGEPEMDFCKQVLSFIANDFFFFWRWNVFFQSLETHNSWQWGKGCTGVKINSPHLKLFQFRGHQSLSLSQRSVAPIYALVNLSHGVRGATTAVCAATEHATLQESMTHNGLGCCWKTS